MRQGKTHSWQRTAKLYRSKGYRVAKVETYSAGRRHDLFGILDGIALGIGSTIGLQACTGSDRAAHVRTLTEERKAETLMWLQAGNELHLIAWRKLKGRWVPRVEIVNTDLTITLVSGRS